MVHAGTCAERRHDAGRMQEEGSSATTATTAAAHRSHSVIDGQGAVQPSGSKSVTPTDSTTYRLVAKGPGGTQEATARVTVNQPPPPPTQAPSASDEQLFNQSVRDIYFDYDKYDIRADQQATAQADAAFLSQHPNIKITI